MAQARKTTTGRRRRTNEGAPPPVDQPNDTTVSEGTGSVDGAAPDAAPTTGGGDTVEAAQPIPAAPLEPPPPRPPVDDPSKAPERVTSSEAGALLAVHAREGTWIIDAATGEPPADPEAVFVAESPHGSAMRCTMRLLQVTGTGPRATRQLVQPLGGVMDRQRADQLVAVMRLQATDRAGT